MKKLSTLLITTAIAFSFASLLAFNFKDAVKEVNAETYEVTLKMDGHGQDILLDVEEGDYIIDVLNQAQFTQEMMIEDGNYYLSGILNANPSTYNDPETLKAAVKEYTNSVITYQATVTEAMDLYTIWSVYPEGGLNFNKIPDQKLQIEQGYAKLGKYSFSDYPYYLIDGKYGKVEIELSHTKLINQSDPNDTIDFELLSTFIECSTLTVGGHEIFLFDVYGKEAKKFREIAADYEYIYLDSYGLIDDYDGISVDGKIAICNRGGQVSFSEKISNALSLGAVGVIVCNYQENYNIMIADYDGDNPSASAPSTSKDYFIEAGTQNQGHGFMYYTGSLTVNPSVKPYVEYRTENDLRFYMEANNGTLESSNITIELDKNATINPDAYYEAEITYRIGGAYTADNQVELKPRSEKTILSIGTKPAQPDGPSEPSEPSNPEEEPSQSGNLPAGAIVGIAAGSTVVVAAGGFSIYWFGIQKKTLKQLFKAIKNIIKKIFKRKEKKNKID